MYVDLKSGQESGPPAGMIVSPDKLQQLRAAFEEEGDRIRTWLRNNRAKLMLIPPPGHDPCSRDTVEVLGLNGQTAIDAAEAYVDRLKTVARKMHESAMAYEGAEDENTSRFRREPG